MSSFISCFLNYNMKDPIFISSQLSSIIILVVIIYFYYNQSHNLMKYKFFFISNLVSCIIIPFFNISYSFCMIINNIIQIGLIIYYYKFIRKKSDKRTKSILFLRICNIVVFNTIFLCN
jgi:hypothetical protein